MVAEAEISQLTNGIAELEELLLQKESCCRRHGSTGDGGGVHGGHHHHRNGDNKQVIVDANELDHQRTLFPSLSNFHLVS